MKRKKTLALYMKEVRDKEGLTQRALAEKLGVSHTYISKIETGHIEIMPSVRFLRDLAAIWNDDPDTALLAAGKVDTDNLEQYLDGNPLASVLINQLVRANSSREYIEKLIDYADELHREGIY